MKKTVTVLAALHLLVGCIIYHPSYPSKWAALTNTNECPNIVGQYTSLGETPKRKGKVTGKVAFGALLLAHDAPQLKDVFYATHVVIEQPDINSIEMSFWEDKLLIYKKSLSHKKGDFSCDTNGIKLKSRTRVVSENLAGFETTTVYLTKSVDGALVAKTVSSGFALAMLLIPMAGSESEWYRFKPTNE